MKEVGKVILCVQVSFTILVGYKPLFDKCNIYWHRISFEMFSVAFLFSNIF